MAQGCTLRSPPFLSKTTTRPSNKSSEGNVNQMSYEFWNVEVQDGISIAALNTGPMNYMTGPALGEF